MPPKRKKVQHPTAARRMPWCRDCGDDYSETCVEEGHKPWTQKMLRMDQEATERAELVERAVAAGDRLKQHIAALSKEANAEIAKVLSQYDGQLPKHLGTLRAAVASGTDCTDVLNATAGVVDKVPQLEACACLLDAKGMLSLVFDHEEGQRWKAVLNLRGGDHAFARHLLLQLQPEAKVEENHPVSPAVEEEKGPDAVDVGKLTGDEVKKLSTK